MKIQLQDKLHDYGRWREQLILAIDRYKGWLDMHELNSREINEALMNMRESLGNERLVIAFAAEFSRGKTELINALFFSDTGVRLLPSSPGRTTMCPTEIFYDAAGGSYIRLLPIESRQTDMTLGEFKRHPLSWMQIELDCSSPVQMQEAFQELAATKRVPLQQAKNLGLYTDESAQAQDYPPEFVEIPCWRHALISFPHVLLKDGLSILDTPGLNALGTEPELTLSMLPSAHAVVFVLAADTGVTKSDLEMWRNHVRGARHGLDKGVAVVMNKIDSMWGDLHGEEVFEKSLRAQIASTATILEVDEKAIFPISAKQALLAKVKGDEGLFEKSRLDGLEKHLARLVAEGRQQLLKASVFQDLERLVNDSASSLEVQLTDASRQLNDMRNLDVNNQEMTRNLLEETREEQQRYLSSVDAFQAGRRVCLAQMKLLIEFLSPEKIDPIIKKARKQMVSSLTTLGMKAAMKALLDELRGHLEKVADTAEETRRLIKAIYGGFHNMPGFEEVKPVLVSFREYELELERLFQEGEDFRNSAASTLMEQTLVVQKLHAVVIARSRDLFMQAHKESLKWSSTALLPLVHQIKDQKRRIESRLEVLRKVNESSESLDGEIDALERQLMPLRMQYDELRDIGRLLSWSVSEESPAASPENQNEWAEAVAATV